MLQDRQIGRPFSIDVDDVGLIGIAVADAADITNRDRASVKHADRQVVEALHRCGAGVELHVVFTPADTGGAGGNDYI